jgi:hypothetical protein
MAHQNRRKFFKQFSAGIGSLLFLTDKTKAKPVNSEGNLHFEKDVPVVDSYDVVICGGGPSGCAAALAASREGLKTLLIESQGQLGGMAVSGLVSHWLGGRSSDCAHWIASGLFKTLSEEAFRKGFALVPKDQPNKKYSPHGWWRGQLTAGIPIDPYGVSYLLDQKMAESGVDVLFLTEAVDVQIQNNKITHILVSNKSGFTAYKTKAVIDATGDADIAFRSGCKVIKGRESDNLMTPTTLIFHVYNVNQEKLSDYIHAHNSNRFLPEIEKWRQQGIWHFKYDRFITVQLIEKDTFMVNTSRLVGIDGTDGKSKSDGMVHGREETFQLMEIMKKHIPGFEDVKLKSIAPLLGVRETRRIINDSMLMVDDLIYGEEFDDTIGFSAYGWDLPDPKRPSYQPLHNKELKRKSVYTPIPYSIMIPKPIENLICPGRAVCVERDVLGPLRVSAPCMVMGEAAGTAVKQVVENEITFKKVDNKRLRNRLQEMGGIVKEMDLPSI